MCRTLDPIDPNDDCPLCNEAYKVRSLIRFEMGEYAMSKKKGYPDFQLDPDEGGPQYFHFDCVLARIDFPNNGLDGRCGVCGDALEHEQVVYRLTCGRINWEDKTFIEDLDDEGLLITIDCCGSCVFNDLGEGNMEQGAYLLQLSEDTILEMFH